MRRLPLPPRRLRWALATGTVLAVFITATVPGTSVGGGVRGVRIDWWLHAAAGMAVAGTAAFALDGPRRRAAVLGGALVIALGVGAAAELLQFGVSGRRPGVGDLVAHAGGAVVLVAAWRIGHRWVRFR